MNVYRNVLIMLVARVVAATQQTYVEHERSFVFSCEVYFNIVVTTIDCEHVEDVCGV